jgi:hypothetical protein
MNEREFRHKLEQALADLDQLRAAVGATAQPQARADLAAAADYWRTHAGTLKAALVLVVDRLRLDVLDALYEWRRQLDEQLGAVRRTPAD